MALPDPAPGLVIGYAYLWRDWALRGRDEGRKDRPCVIILSVQTMHDRTVVTVAPITHAPPARPELAIEVPAATKRRLGLDDDRSWIVASDLNQFVWPGGDLRPVSRGAQRFDYGLLPAPLFASFVTASWRWPRRDRPRSPHEATEQLLPVDEIQKPLA